MDDATYEDQLRKHSLALGTTDYLWKAEMQEVLGEALDRSKEHSSLETMHGQLFEAMSRAYSSMMSGDNVEALLILEEWVG